MLAWSGLAARSLSGWRNNIASVGASSLGEGGWRTRYWPRM
jgi:hypothetical protein